MLLNFTRAVHFPGQQQGRRPKLCPVLGMMQLHDYFPFRILLYTVSIAFCMEHNPAYGTLRDLVLLA